MNKILKPLSFVALATMMAIPVTATTSAPAAAGSRDAFVGGIVGGVIGGAIGSNVRRSRQPDVVYVEREPRYVERRVIRRSRDAHVDYCFRKYRSYDARSNTFVSYGGRVKRCNSPYD